MGEKRFRNAPNSRTLVTCDALYRSKNVGDTSGYPFPEFYDICQNPKSTVACNATLNCLGLIQKAYVESMVDLVKQNSGGSDHVFFEIMNRIRYDESEPYFKLDQLKRWHDVIGYWIKCRSDNDCSNSKGDYLVSAVVGVADYNDLSCFNPANCPENTLEIFKMPNIDIANLPAHAWTNSPGAVGPCESAKIANKKFRKPVIIDSDGTFEERNDKCQVKNWAQEITACGINGFPNSGQAHFNHLDGMTFRESAAKRCFFTGGASPLNLDFDERYLDCHTLDTIGDATPTYLSNVVTTAVPQSCPHSTSQKGRTTWCAEVCE